MEWSGWLVAAILLGVILAGCTAPVREDQESSMVTQVLHCPAPCSVQIDEGVRRWEPSVAVDPADPSHVVASSHDHDPRPGRSLATHWGQTHVSFDGGQTWQTSRVPGGEEGPPDHPLARFNALDDSVITVHPDGDVLLAALVYTRSAFDEAAGKSGLTLVVLRSTDGGITFPEVVTVAEGTGWEFPGQNVAYEEHDKQWLTVGPDGTVLLVWQINRRGNPACPTFQEECGDLVFSTSSDAGQTWSAPRSLASGAFSGASPLIRKDGGWVVAFRDTAAEKVRVAVSADAGATWTSQEVDDATKFPALARVDEAHGERIYLVYPASTDDRDDPQTVTLRWSDDGGMTWSGPVIVADSTAAGRTVPAIAAAGNDGVYITYWLPGAEDASYQATLFRSGNLTKPIVIGNTTGSSASTGDYMGLASDGNGGAFAVWTASTETGATVQGAQLVVREAG